MKTLYETNWHYVNDHLSHCTVTPIKVVWEGVAPGCSAPSIEAIGADGRRFRGSARNYYETEELAREALRLELQDAANDLQRAIDDHTAELAAVRAILESWT